MPWRGSPRSWPSRPPEEPSISSSSPSATATPLKTATRTWRWRERTSQIDAICDATVAASPSLRVTFTGCNATLEILLNRADAMDPSNSTAFDSALTDGAFILGGDQNLAMTILADSPAEQAMARAHRRGVLISGTSAGDAVQSRSMTAGYSADGYAENGLEKDSPVIWWGDDGDQERGLSFGSRRTIFDQHFYQRGRFGRLLT